MAYVKTDYVLGGYPVEYELLENGYQFRAGDLSMIQTEPFIPFKDVSYEESCIKQIERMVADEEDNKKRKLSVEDFQEKVLQNEADNAYLAMMLGIDL